MWFVYTSKQNEKKIQEIRKILKIISNENGLYVNNYSNDMQIKSDI